MTAANNIKKYWKEQGIFKLLKRGIYRTFQFVFAYLPINYYVIYGQPDNPPEPRCPLTIRKGNPEDHALIDEMLEYSYKSPDSILRKRVKQCFDSGAQVFLAFSGDKLVNVSWLHYWPGVSKIYPNVKIREDEAFFGHIETHPEFRGNNIYPVLIQHMMDYAANNKIKRCYGRTIPKHSVSIKGINKTGFSLVMTKHRFVLFGKMFNCKWDSSKLPEH